MKTVQFIYNEYKTIFQTPIDKVGEIGVSIPIPTFDSSTISELCAFTIERVKNRPILLELSAPIYIIGDLHGNIFDLIRIFILAVPPPTSRLLFLGDYVDRGQYSVEVVTLLFTFYCMFPDHVFLLRGNHEFESINEVYGFKTEVMTQYDNFDVFDQINEVFLYLPLAAVINNSIFCVHGGISPGLSSFKQFAKIKRPLLTYDVDFVSDLMWSDPSTTDKGYVRSSRGTGVTYGTQVTDEFLQQFGLQKIVRAHQCVKMGIAKFNRETVLTVFSSSNYSEADGNRCGIIFVGMDLKLQMFSLPPLTQYARSLCYLIEVQQNEAPEERKNSLALNIKLKELKTRKHSSVRVRKSSLWY